MRKISIALFVLIMVATTSAWSTPRIDGSSSVHFNDSIQLIMRDMSFKQAMVFMLSLKELNAMKGGPSSTLNHPAPAFLAYVDGKTPGQIVSAYKQLENGGSSGSARARLNNTQGRARAIEQKKASWEKEMESAQRYQRVIDEVPSMHGA